MSHKELKKFIEESDPIQKIVILLDTFSYEQLQDIFNIELSEDYVECLDVYTAYDFITQYEQQIINKWANL